MERALKLVESEPDPLAVLMGELRAKAEAKAEADRLGLEVSLAPIVDEIELELSEENAELEDARRLRRLAKLREAAALQHAIRIGKLLLRAKRDVPHGQFQDWVERNFSGKAASEYMRIAKTSKRGMGQMNNDATQAEYKAVERAQVEEAKRMATTLERQREREAAKAAFLALTQNLRRPDVGVSEPAQVLKRRF